VIIVFVFSFRALQGHQNRCEREHEQGLQRQDLRPGQVGPLAQGSNLYSYYGDLVSSQLLMTMFFQTKVSIALASFRTKNF
jgi:hypothetical protein